MSKIKAGDTVIIRKPEKADWLFWSPGMDKLNGKKTKISNIENREHGKIFVFDGWLISLDWCEKISPEPPDPLPRPHKKSKKKKIKKLEKEIKRLDKTIDMLLGDYLDKYMDVIS